jgi:uncharacterized membrane protein YccF (DUF307 family)
MITLSESRPIRYCLFLAQAASVIAIVVGGLALVGWWLDIRVFTSVLPGYVTMKPNTAACFALSGISLWLLLASPSQSNSVHPTRRLAAQACAAVVALVGLLTLGEYLLHLNVGIDELLVREKLVATQISYPGRMSPATMAVV